MSNVRTVIVGFLSSNFQGGMDVNDGGFSMANEHSSVIRKGNEPCK